MRTTAGYRVPTLTAGTPTGAIPSVRSVLQWVYLGRVVVAIVVFVAAAFSFEAIEPATLVILAVAALLSVIVSTLSVWWSHIRAAAIGMTFLYAQAIFDLGLVTTVVHVTEGPDSQFPALYVLVIAVSAVLMPFASSLLITTLAGLLYLADIVWWHPVQLSVAVWLQIAVFVVVFAATGFIASRVRVAGAEREVLREEVRRLRLEAIDVLRNIRSGVLTVDPGGVVAYANPAAFDILGLTEASVVGYPLDQLVGERAPSLVTAIQDTQRSKRKAMRSEADVHLDERTFPIGVTTTSIDEEGGDDAPSVTAIFTDISDQKRIEELHLRTERREAVAELSASLAHEIKNPLASIRSSIEQLAAASRSDDDERFLLQLVLRESDRLSRLLSEFLDFSRVRVSTSRTVDLGEIAERGVQVVREHPDCSERVDIRVDRTPTQLVGDEDLLHRVVVNLVLNAVQAMSDGGQVTIEVRDARPEDLPLGVRLESAALMRVIDDGPGVPPELRDRLFEPFVTGRPGGSGLGLAIVQRAVQVHRGFVLVDSQPGAGTSVNVVIPSSGTSEVAA
jgi:two-component system sensor histidine kinase PilS (NtrC family)